MRRSAVVPSRRRAVAPTGPRRDDSVLRSQHLSSLVSNSAVLHPVFDTRCGCCCRRISCSSLLPRHAFKWCCQRAGSFPAGDSVWRHVGCPLFPYERLTWCSDSITQGAWATGGMGAELAHLYQRKMFEQQQSPMPLLLLMRSFTGISITVVFRVRYLPFGLCPI